MIIDPHGPEPAYLQVAAVLRERILSGEYRPGQAIPSIKELTDATGLAVATVRKGIATLIEEGRVYTVPGRGTFVGRRDT